MESHKALCELLTVYRVQPPSELVGSNPCPSGGHQAAFYVIRFRLPELLDCVPGRVPVLPRYAAMVRKHHSILEQLRKDSQRRAAQCSSRHSRALIQASLSVTATKEDDGGSIRGWSKRGSE